jgi:hypothetical protein
MSTAIVLFVRLVEMGVCILDAVIWHGEERQAIARKTILNSCLNLLLDRVYKHLYFHTLQAMKTSLTPACVLLTASVAYSSPIQRRQNSAFE